MIEIQKINLKKILLKILENFFLNIEIKNEIFYKLKNFKNIFNNNIFLQISQKF